MPCITKAAYVTAGAPIRVSVQVLTVKEGSAGAH
jgi:hypothetical protein